MNKVQVLISTYNGVQFLDAQLESIENQLDVELSVSIRDDGSSDGTLELLSTYSEFANYQIKFELNCGVIESFLKLLSSTASQTTNFYSFCDQDDVWEPGKLNRAISKLSKIPPEVPAMYCARTELVNHELNHIGYWPPVPSKATAFSNALIENIAVGCTIVINKAARDLILSKLPDPKKLIMHDWWIYLVISAFGQVVYDPVPSVKYRQHGTNVMGGDVGGISRWKKKLSNFRKNRNKRLLRKQAMEFYRLFYAELPDSHKGTIDRFLNSNISWFRRIKYAWSMDVYRQSVADHWLFRLLYVFNKI